MAKPEDGRTYGLIGERLEHSHSARLHALLGGYPYALIPLKPEALDGFLRAGAFAGLNVTIPYKRQAIPYCAALSETARAVGSVNTLIRREDGSLFGDNTDAFGFSEMARRAGVEFAGQKALVLGSGGTSLTACHVIREAGGKPVVISRKGENRYEDIPAHGDAAYLVNTTPVGMYPSPEAAPVDLRMLPELRAVLDVVYNPLRTRLLRQAEAMGIPGEGGLSMLVAQAARAAELFLGCAVPRARKEDALRALRKRVTNLVLIGMPGSGKTMLGRRLAAMLQMPLVDLDAEAEREAGCSVVQLFQRQGEAAFRALEARLAERYGREGGRVLVTGGGAPVPARNRENLRMNGFVVHVTRPLSLLSMRGRPLSKSREELARLWREREPLYAACADFTVANDKTPARCAEAIKEAFHEALYH